MPSKSTLDPDYFDEDVPVQDQIVLLKNALCPQSRVFGMCASMNTDYIARVLANSDSKLHFIPIQFNTSSLVSLKYVSPVHPDWVCLARNEKISLFGHLPYVIPPYRDFNTDSQYSYGLLIDSYFARLGELIADADIPLSFVLHCGYPDYKLWDAFYRERYIDDSPERKQELLNVWYNTQIPIFKKNLRRWLSYLPDTCCILIENLPGSSKHPIMSYTPVHLYESFFQDYIDVSSDPLDYKRFGLCLDTEHAWSSGVYWPALRKFLEYTSVSDLIHLIHFNAAPQTVKFGSHIDKHSYTEISSAMARGHMFNKAASFTDQYSLPYIINYVLSNDIPCVFERHNYSTIFRDMQYVSGYAQGMINR